ncbi:hypothetical protein [Edaphobacter aggregans]|uniref:hypothetical protein n=1 Tax=Edaphobacter aggregans TaxID=570835 RepID=UPI0012FB074A|nr:hypothetical protein [Edaphobacter aggregans]
MKSSRKEDERYWRPLAGSRRRSAKPTCSRPAHGTKTCAAKWWMPSPGKNNMGGFLQQPVAVIADARRALSLALLHSLQMNARCFTVSVARAINTPNLNSCSFTPP